MFMIFTLLRILGKIVKILSVKNVLSAVENLHYFKFCISIKKKFNVLLSYKGPRTWNYNEMLPLREVYPLPVRGSVLNWIFLQKKMMFIKSFLAKTHFGKLGTIDENIFFLYVLPFFLIMDNNFYINKFYLEESYFIIGEPSLERGAGYSRKPPLVTLLVERGQRDIMPQFTFTKTRDHCLPISRGTFITFPTRKWSCRKRDNSYKMRLNIPPPPFSLSSTCI